MTPLLRPRLARPATLLRFIMLLAVLIWWPGFGSQAHAASVDPERAQTIVHMLDYVGVDYPGSVRDGAVLDPGEYEEQRDFVSQSIVLLGQLPATAAQPGLLEDTRRLMALIDAKAPGAEVAALAAKLRTGVIQAYALSVAPRQAPDLAQGARLFEAECAACHGSQGGGDGPLAKGMTPAPSDFHDDERMKQRSLYGLFNSITLGVAGTSMRSFNALSTADRWALTFHVAGLRSTPQVLARGQALWDGGKGRQALGDLRALVTATPEQLAAQEGDELDAVRAWLTRHPQAVLAEAPGPIAFAQARLQDTVQAYRSGDREAARRLAIAAYLEGFELVEAALDNVDKRLRSEIEGEMMALRTSIGNARPVDEIVAQVARIDTLLTDAGQKISGDSLSPTAAFLSALLILLREGLEAILVLAAMSAFLIKSGRRDALRYLHAGWIGAMVLGALTWLAAQRFLTISGASRELTEGITALLAAAMLFYVGYWLHSRSKAHAWQVFIRDQMTSALGKRTLWAIAGVSFLAVYRELFEVILFYETLWAQVGPEGYRAVLGGIGAAIVLLALLGGALLRYSVRLPIGPFFTATSALLALLAVVFVGSGVKALQEAGVLDSTAIRFVSAPLLGVHPTAQGLAAQLAALLLVGLGIWLNRRKRA